jgi:hypothetical protein
MALVYEYSEDSSEFITKGIPVLIPLKWRQVTTTMRAPRNMKFTERPVGGNLPGGSGDLGRVTTLGAWQSGGSASAGTRVCYFAYGGTRSYAWDGPWPYRNVFYSDHVEAVEIFNFEVDMEDAMATLRATYNPALYTIGSFRMADEEGENWEELGEKGKITTNNLNMYFQDTGNTGNVVPVEAFGDFGYEGDTVDFTQEVRDNRVTLPYVSDFTITPITPGSTVNEAAHNMGQGCVGDLRSVPMYLIVWVVPTADLSGSAADLSGSAPDIIALSPLEGWDDTLSPVTVGTSGGSTGSGSSSQGMNSFYSTYGNSILPFNSVYLTGSNYNSFVAAGGGIISESGVFPKSDTLYIEKIRLDVEGSSMTVIEVVDFDAEPSLVLSERLYAYILDENNSDKPAFCGFVVSRRRKLTGTTQEIVYECRDLSYFLDQLYGPSHYIYRAPSVEGSGIIKSYDRVLKENLNIAGITDAIVSVPYYTAPPMNWVYEPIKGILEWAVKFFGKYVYFVDRYGRLNVQATDSGSLIKTYTIGDKSGEISVESFEPIADFSRSRSRIILTGDYEITEYDDVNYYTMNSGELDPRNNEGTGLYWFYETIDGKQYKFYYFMFHPDRTLNDRLLSDPSASAKVILMDRVFDTNQTVELNNQEELNIRVFKTDPGDSEIYVEDSRLNYAGRQKIRVMYATRSDSPIQVSVETGLFGGTEVIRRPEFKKATSSEGVINDLPLMQSYANQLRDFYKPIYGGQLVLDGIDSQLYLLGKVSIAGSDLSSTEASNLICYSIEYDLVNKRTVVDLSNKVYDDLPYFDIIRERTNANNLLLSKMGLVEEAELYKKL